MLSRFVVSLVILALSSTAAQAQKGDPPCVESEVASCATHFEPKLRANYLWNGGAVPFIYGAGALTLALRLFVDPPKKTRFFPESEGGENVFGDTVPEALLGGFAFAGAALVAAIPQTGRWYHLKGYAQAAVTTLAITEIAKNTVGRHRPTYREEDAADDLDLRRSFFSGHASLTAATTVYLGLYLGRNVFPSLASPRMSVYRAATLVGLGTILVGVPLSRLKDNRHHLSDVMTGAFVGSAMAVAFYAYQESRLQQATEAFQQSKRSAIVLLPDVVNRGLVLSTRW